MRVIKVTTKAPEIWSTLIHRYSGNKFGYAEIIPRGMFLVPILPENQKVLVPVAQVDSATNRVSTAVPPWKR